MASFTIDDFLAEADVQEIDWVRPAGSPTALNPVRVDIGFGPDALEVALATSTTPPKMDDVRRLWAMRWNRRAAPVLLVVAYEAASGWEATVCGPSEDPAAIAGLDLSQVERICAAALSAPTASEAKRTLQRLLVGPKDQLIAGLTNQGLFASHELRHGVPARPDWATARDTGKTLLGKTGQDLIVSLGYTATAHGSIAQVLSTGTARHALALLLNENELFERPGQRFGSVSPVTQGLALAQEQNLPWLIVMRGNQIRLYPAKPDVGVGRKGQSETFVELDLALLTDEDAGYLPLLFSPAALTEHGTVAAILAASVDHASALGARLRDRVYIDVVPALAVAVANAMKSEKGDVLDEADLHEAYHRTLLILFRLLFVAYAEDRGLLPYQRNPRYDRKALKTLAREFADDSTVEFDHSTFDRWDDLLAVWRAVDDGNREWGVPAYNGGLFASDADLHPSGHAIGQMRLTNAEIGPALKALLIDTGDDGDLGPVDFRSLSVREFGTIYEGLLESSLSIAPSDLTVDPKTKAYLPVVKVGTVEVHVGDVYFHNASGARKATGSYFTKAFAVEHLLDTALEPALTDHLARVEALIAGQDEASAAEKFFDFRVADLAMGSGHFLVAAIDRIENRFAKFLTQHPIPTVNDELTRLAQAATEALGEGAAHVEIEPSMLLRRQIARRCIYGLDLNLMAVELARLGIWIHTFVPGLPMSALDHGLRVGNSLTGIGTVDEALDVFEPGIRDGGQYSLFGEQIEQALGVARDRLLRVARTAEATKAEVRDAARAHAKAMEEASDVRALLDAAVAVRLGDAGMPSGPAEAIELGNSDAVVDRIAGLSAAHLPYLFPEVFLRDNPGFDVLLGNPPWEELVYEEIKFWTLQFPGLKSMSASDQTSAVTRFRKSRPDLVSEMEDEMARNDDLRTVLMAGPYPGLGEGHADLYKAFCWRTWQSLRQEGRCGLVLPRGALSAAGSASWRLAVLDGGSFEDVLMLVNSGRWVFDDVHPQYTVGLVTTTKLGTSGQVALRGPFHSLQEFVTGVGKPPTSFAASEFRTWTSGANFPLLPSNGAGEIFRKLRQHPRLDSEVGSWAFRPLQGDFNQTTDRRYFDVNFETGDMTVLKGSSFNIWNPDAGEPFALARSEEVIPSLTEKRRKSSRRANSAFTGLPPHVVNDPKTLPCLAARIAFRDITRATDTRTVIAALVPPNVVLTNKAPYLVRRSGTPADEAYLLGVLSSVILDWYARRYVELSLNFHILNAFPIPRPDAESPLRRRVVEISGRLGAIDARYAEWASEVGVPVGSITTDAIKSDLVAELDALVALLYGLDRADVELVFATFHRGWDYQPRLDAVLAHYDAWKLKEN